MGWEVVVGGTGVVFLGRKELKCFIRRRGPMVLVRKVERHAWASFWEGDFSACRMPGMAKARRGWDFEGGKRDLARGGCA